MKTTLLPEIKKGAWTLEEDKKLLKWVKKEGACKWALCANTIEGRIGRQCRERWYNSLNPNIKKGKWTSEEDYLIFYLYNIYGGKWSKISSYIPKRTENAIKNRFYSFLRQAHIKTRKTPKNPQKLGTTELINYFPQCLKETEDSFRKNTKMSNESFLDFKNQLNTKIEANKKSLEEVNETSGILKSTPRFLYLNDGIYQFNFTINKICNSVACANKNKKGKKYQDETKLKIDNTISDSESGLDNSKKNSNKSNFKSNLSKKLDVGGKTLFINCNFNIENNFTKISDNLKNLQTKNDVNCLIEELSALELAIRSAKFKLIEISKGN